MIFVFLSVCFSVLVSVLIKLAKQREINTQQMVLWNYPVAVLLTYVLLKPNFQIIDESVLPFSLYIPLAILLPSLFIVLALSIHFTGIVKTDIAQRLSLFIPLMAAFILFDEQIKEANMLGIVVGLVAIICSISWGKELRKVNPISMIYPFVVFIGMGVIDVLFKQIAQHKEVNYINSMFIVFVLSMLVAFVILIVKVVFLKRKFDRRSIAWGTVLGIFNFGNIYLYMKAHRALPENPSIVFTAMNIGVIVLGSIVGIMFFREKLSVINKIGVILAIIAVLIIAYL